MRRVTITVLIGIVLAVQAVSSINKQFDHKKPDENLMGFDDFSEMDYVLFLETNAAYGTTLDYYKYGIYGDLTNAAVDGEALYFRLNESILQEEPLSDELPVPMTHGDWAGYTEEHIVYMTPDLEWIITRQFADPEIAPCAYHEKWYHKQDVVSEINGDLTMNIQAFISKKDVSNGYEAMSETQVQKVNELLNEIYDMRFAEVDDKRICFDESGKLLAAGECRQEGVSIYDIYEEKCIRIYDISKEETELLYELPIPKSEIAWPVEISQFVGDRERGWLVFSAGDSTYKINYPAGEACKLGEFMFGTSYSPDEKYVAYCTGNNNLFDSWEDMYEGEEANIPYLDLYHSMRERWDAIAPGWYVEELETGRKTYIPIETWTYDSERPIYGGKCIWIERDQLLRLLK